MTPAPSFELAPQLSMRVSPALAEFAEMLALPTDELEERVGRELGSSAALERGDGVADDGSGSAPVRDSGAEVAAPALRRAPGAAPPHRPRSDVDRVALLADEPTLATRLLAELRLLLDERDHPIAAFAVGNLDERGFSDLDADEIALRLGVERRRVEHVLVALSEVGPPGVGATDVRGCLLLQIERLRAGGGRGEQGAARARLLELAEAIVRDKLAALARGAVAEIAAATGASRADVAAAGELIRRELAPYPVMEATLRDRPAALTPDLVIRERPHQRGEYDVEVAGPAPLAVGALQRELAATCPALRREVARARAFAARLDERRAALERVAAAVVAHQKAFLRDGARALRPLTRAQLARELGLHESTVGRAVAGKHVLLPDGRLLPFERFFDAALPALDSLTAIVAAEPRPLSDAELAFELGRAGFRVARRTVAKYRQRLGILPQALR